MKTVGGETIMRTDPWRRKFGDAMAEYLWYRMLDGDDGDDWIAGGDGCSVTRFGRTLLICDSVGFVDRAKHTTVRDAEIIFEEQRWLWEEYEEE